MTTIFHLAARRSIRRRRLSRVLITSPALCTVVQRVLILVTACAISDDYKQSDIIVNMIGDNFE